MWKLEDYRIATSPDEAVALMNEGPGRGVYIAGGTDLFLFPPECDFAVDVSRAGLDDLAGTDEGDLVVGAGVTLHRLETDPTVAGFAHGALAAAAAVCGNRPVRTTATIGGNLCNGLPSADMAPVLLALDADCFILGEDDRESLPLSHFFVAPRVTALEGRLLAGLALPAAAAGRRCLARKLTRSAEDISLIQVAVGLDVSGGVLETVRIALGAVAPVPLRSTLAEDQLAGQALADIGPDLVADAAVIAAGECEPIDDHRASAEYRRAMVEVFTRRLLTEALTAEGWTNGEGTS
jgi:carbon-monoxide dehydrogenase medium subunit